MAWRVRRLRSASIAAFCGLLVASWAFPQDACAGTGQIAVHNILVRPPAGWSQARVGPRLILRSPTSSTGDYAEIILIPDVTPKGPLKQWVGVLGKGTASKLGTIVRTVAYTGNSDSATITLLFRTGRGVLTGGSFSAFRVNTAFYLQFYSATNIATFNANGATLEAFQRSFSAVITSRLRAPVQAAASNFVGSWGCVSFQISGGNSVCPAGNFMDIRPDGTYLFHGLLGRYHLAGNTIFFDSGGYAAFGSGRLRSDGLIEVDVQQQGAGTIYYFKRTG